MVLGRTLFVGLSTLLLPMSIEFFCPRGHRLSAAKRKAGGEVRCPVCGERAIVAEQGDAGPASGEDPQPARLEVVDAILVPRDPATGWGPPPLPGSRRSEAPRQQDCAAAKPPLPLGDPQIVPPPVGRPSRPARRGRAVDLACAYRPDGRRVRTCRWLGLFLVLVVGFSTYPAWEHVDLRTSPDWARVVWLVAALEGVYIVWMLAAPDWASLWVLTLVFAFVAAAYGAATAITMVAPPDRPIPLDLDALGDAAPRWCGLVLLLSLLAAYSCGNASVRWRRSFELRRRRARQSPVPRP